MCPPPTFTPPFTPIEPSRRAEPQTPAPERLPNDFFLAPVHDLFDGLTPSDTPLTPRGPRGRTLV